MDPQPPNDLPAVPPPMPIAPPPDRHNGLAVASLVLGISSIALFFTVVFPFILGTLAVIFGVIGWTKANKGAPQKGLAIAGSICGAFGIALAILVLALFSTASFEFHTFSPSFSPMP
jgi:hypothetical protein